MEDGSWLSAEGKWQMANDKWQIAEGRGLSEGNGMQYEGGAFSDQQNRFLWS
jgi:hypothetical protein